MKFWGVLLRVTLLWAAGGWEPVLAQTERDSGEVTTAQTKRDSGEVTTAQTERDSGEVTTATVATVATVGFLKKLYTVSENVGTTSIVKVTIEVEESLQHAIMVGIQIEDSTGTSFENLQCFSAGICPPGEICPISIPVTVIDNQIMDRNRNFTLKLMDMQGVAKKPKKSEATLQILDDDKLQIGFSSEEYWTFVDTSKAITVVKTGFANEDISVIVNLQGREATLTFSNHFEPENKPENKSVTFEKMGSPAVIPISLSLRNELPDVHVLINRDSATVIVSLGVQDQMDLLQAHPPTCTPTCICKATALVPAPSALPCTPLVPAPTALPCTPSVPAPSALPSPTNMEDETVKFTQEKYPVSDDGLKAQVCLRRDLNLSIPIHGSSGSTDKGTVAFIDSNTSCVDIDVSENELPLQLRIGSDEGSLSKTTVVVTVNFTQENYPVNSEFKANVCLSRNHKSKELQVVLKGKGKDTAEEKGTVTFTEEDTACTDIDVHAEELPLKLTIDSGDSYDVDSSSTATVVKAKVKFTHEEYPVTEESDKGPKAHVCLKTNLKTNNLKVKIILTKTEPEVKVTVTFKTDEKDTACTDIDVHAEELPLELKIDPGDSYDVDDVDDVDSSSTATVVKAKVKFTEKKYPVKESKAHVCLSTDLKTNNLEVKIIPTKTESEVEGTVTFTDKDKNEACTDIDVDAEDLPLTLTLKIDSDHVYYVAPEDGNSSATVDHQNDGNNNGGNETTSNSYVWVVVVFIAILLAVAAAYVIYHQRTKIKACLMDGEKGAAKGRKGRYKKLPGTIHDALHQD